MVGPAGADDITATWFCFSAHEAVRFYIGQPLQEARADTGGPADTSSCLWSQCSISVQSFAAYDTSSCLWSQCSISVQSFAAYDTSSCLWSQCSISVQSFAAYDTSSCLWSQCSISVQSFAAYDTSSCLWSQCSISVQSFAADDTRKMGVFGAVAKSILRSPAIGLIVFLFIVDFIGGDFVFSCPCDKEAGDRKAIRKFYTSMFLICPTLTFVGIDNRVWKCFSWTHPGRPYCGCWLTSLRPFALAGLWIFFFLCSERFIGCFDNEKLCRCSGDTSNDDPCTKKRIEELPYQISAAAVLLFFLFILICTMARRHCEERQGNMGLPQGLEMLDSSTVLTLFEERLFLARGNTYVIYDLSDEEVRKLPIPIGHQKIIQNHLAANRNAGDPAPDNAVPPPAPDAVDAPQIEMLPQNNAGRGNQQAANA